MALREDPRFGRAMQTPPPDVFDAVLTANRLALERVAWVHCGYASLPAVSAFSTPPLDVQLAVDNSFRLGPTCGFERVPAIVTTGLRTSRFAPVLFWEVLHALEPGGIWIDIDDAGRCAGTPLNAEDFPVREYFRTCLRPVFTLNSTGSGRRCSHGRTARNSSGSMTPPRA